MAESVEVFVCQDGVDTCSFDVPLNATVQEMLEGACHPGCGFVRNLRCLHIRAMVGSVAQGCAERPPGFETDDSDSNDDGDDADDDGDGAEDPGDGAEDPGDGADDPGDDVIADEDGNIGVHRVFLSHCMGIIRTADSDEQSSDDKKQDDDKTGDDHKKKDDDKYGDDSKKKDDDTHGDDSKKKGERAGCTQPSEQPEKRSRVQ